MVAVLAVLVALALLWRVGSVVLRAVAWCTVAAIALSVVIGVDVPAAAPAMAGSTAWWTIRVRRSSRD